MSEARNFIRFITFFGIVIGVLVVVGLVLSSSCKAQTTPEGYRKSLLIYAFKGLNTTGGVFGSDPDYSPVFVNVDPSRFGANTIGLRYGFDSVKTVHGIDSIVGFDTYQRSDRQSCLVYAVDDSTKGYGAIYATRFGSDNPDSARKIKDYWSIQSPTRISQYNDNLYATNGQQQGILWNGDRVSKFPLTTPGMPDIIPLKTAGNLNGQYRYCMHGGVIWKSGTQYVLSAGPISPPINVVNGQVLLRNFGRMFTDSILTSCDTAIMWISRTHKNPGPIDDFDSIFFVGSIYLKRGGNDSIADTVTFTDNYADASLTSYLTPGLLNRNYGRDSTGAISTRRWTAPTFISSDTNNTTAWQMWSGHTPQSGNLGYAYVVTATDTITGLESDTTRSLWVRQKIKLDSSYTFDRLTIGLPRIGRGDSGLVFNIYRANILVTARPFFLVCASQHYEPGSTTPTCDRWDTIWTSTQPDPGDSYWWPKPGIRVDSGVAADWYKVAQVPTTQTQFTDSIRTDSLYLRGQRFNLSTQPDIFSYVFKWRSRLGGVAGSRIWFSKQFVDSAGNFGTNDFDDFNRNDGDFITAIGEAQWGLKVKKNRAGYVLPNGGGRPEKVSSFGCVAPLSFISTDVGDLFVGDGGVYLETEGQALERVYNAGLVSEKLSNFVNMPDSVRRTISGFWLPEKRQAIFSADYPNTSNDTAFVLDFRAGQIWTTWTNMVPKFGCLYSKNSTLGSPPPQTFYFTKAGGKVIYKYGTSNYDIYFDSLPNLTYETPLLFADPDYEQIDAIGVVSNSFVADEDYINARVYDQRWYKTSSVITLDSLANVENGSGSSLYGVGYCTKDVNGPVCRGSRIRLYSGTSNNQMISGAIEGLYIYYRTNVERSMRK